MVATPVAATAALAGQETLVAVVAGDNLWDLAAARLATATGRARATLDNAEIAILGGGVRRQPCACAFGQRASHLPR